MESGKDLELVGPPLHGFGLFCLFQLMFACVLPGRSLEFSRSPANYALSVLQFDFVELLDGRRLLTQEARSLEGAQRQSRGAVPPSSHETGFIQYLDSGIWHLAFYNDGKESEVVSFLTTAIGKESPPLWGMWGIVCLGKRTPGSSGLKLTAGCVLSRAAESSWIQHEAILTGLAGQRVGVRCGEMKGGNDRRSCKAMRVPSPTAHHLSLWSVAWCADQPLHLNTEG